MPPTEIRVDSRCSERLARRPECLADVAIVDDRGVLGLLAVGEVAPGDALDRR
jgi:hypothetical protein